MILDVGCGDSPKGDVNCDLKRPIVYKNFIQCDAYYLPFKDETFSVVRGSAILEHLCEPLLALKEFKRVSQKFIYLKVPNNPKILGPQRKDHMFAWDKTTLENFLSILFPTVKVYSSNREINLGFFMKKSRLMCALVKVIIKNVLPNELTAICGASLKKVWG